MSEYFLFGMKKKSVNHISAMASIQLLHGVVCHHKHNYIGVTLLTLREWSDNHIKSYTTSIGYPNLTLWSKALPFVAGVFLVGQSGQFLPHSFTSSEYLCQ